MYRKSTRLTALAEQKISSGKIVPFNQAVTMQLYVERAEMNRHFYLID
jgi:hypothetical protein